MNLFLVLWWECMSCICLGTICPVSCLQFLLNGNTHGHQHVTRTPDVKQLTSGGKVSEVHLHHHDCTDMCYIVWLGVISATCMEELWQKQTLLVLLKKPLKNCHKYNAFCRNNGLMQRGLVVALIFSSMLQCAWSPITAPWSCLASH